MLLFINYCLDSVFSGILISISKYGLFNVDTRSRKNKKKHFIF